MRPVSRRILAPALAILPAVVLAAALAGVRAAEPKFYPDDPIGRAPETADASGAAPWEIDLFYDLSYNLFATARREVVPTRAQNLNTIDEVPDSSWFTNRIGTRELRLDEVLRGPAEGAAPDPSGWTITREKSSGAAPGFTARDAQGHTWFVSFDPPSNPEGATGALVVATKIFWALGYNQIEYFLTTMKPGSIQIDPGATKKRPNGARTRLTASDLHEVLERAHRSADGSYRTAAGRLLTGKVLGGFRYEGTRPDDPNDLVAHENRRELRALRVFGAWTNLTDMKAGNTLDTVVTENGRGIVRHYLQDVGSTFGVGANGPHDWYEGFEYVYDREGTRKRAFSLGLRLSPWQTASYEDVPAIGRFESAAFDPETWRPRVPTKAYMAMRDDDAFWAARRVMAFSDGMIREIAKTGGFSDPRAAELLATILIQRRDKIGRAYLPKVNPIVDPVLDASNTLRFGNAAVDNKVAEAPESYTAGWSTFDNATGASTPIAETTGRQAALPAPAGLPASPGAFVKVSLSARSASHPAWATPVDVFFRRSGNGWSLVGLERMK